MLPAVVVQTIGDGREPGPQGPVLIVGRVARDPTDGTGRAIRRGRRVGPSADDQGLRTRQRLPGIGRTRRVAERELHARVVSGRLAFLDRRTGIGEHLGRRDTDLVKARGHAEPP